MVDTQVFAQHRLLLFDVAYRMTGSVADAEDLVQPGLAHVYRLLGWWRAAVRSGQDNRWMAIA